MYIYKYILSTVTHSLPRCQLLSTTETELKLTLHHLRISSKTKNMATNMRQRSTDSLKKCTPAHFLLRQRNSVDKDNFSSCQDDSKMCFGRR